LERGEEQEEDDSNNSDGSDSDDDYIDGQDSNGSEGPRPAKRRKPSPYGHSTSKRSGKVRFHLPHNGHLGSPSNLDKGCIAPVRTRLVRPPSSSNHLQQFPKSLSHSPLNDDEPTSNTTAEYQEWPMCGFIKRVTIEDEIRYSMEFNLEQVQEPRARAIACPLHMPSSQLLGIADNIEGSEEEAQVVNANQEWEIHNIIGKEDVDGIVHYLVEWNPTLMPAHELKNAKELVNKFEARLQAQARQENGRGRPSLLKAGQRAILKAHATVGTQQKRRGRPRKET
jgi:hypothetical protein